MKSAANIGVASKRQHPPNLKAKLITATVLRAASKSAKPTVGRVRPLTGPVGGIDPGRGNRSIALMCNLYSITRGQDAIRRLFRVTRDLAGNLPALPAVHPDTMAPVVRVARDGERELTMMRWGFPPLPTRGKAPLTNVRNVKSPYWCFWLKTEWRCLVPATSFCEWSGSRPKVPHWFALDESRPLFAFAGIWRLWTGERKGAAGRHELFSFLTTEANEVVRPVHAMAMPVLLTAAGDWDTWLTGVVDEAMALQRPLKDEMLRVVATGDKTDSTLPA